MPSGQSFLETIDYGETGEAFLLPRNMIAATMTLSPTGGNAKVQYTDSAPEQVYDSTAVWVDWPDGSVSSVTTAIIYGASALRQVCETATESTLIIAVQAGY